MMVLMNAEMGRQRREELLEQACRERQQRLALDRASGTRRRRSLLRRKSADFS
jgi:hypothetical protein